MKKIKNFKLDTSDIKQNGERRSFTVIADNGSVFSLLVLNEDSHYYNFETNAFSAVPARLDNVIVRNGSYTGYINFPKITDDDHYDVYLYASLEHETEHASFIEKRYPDGTIDFNSSFGSNSALLIKKIYQYTDVTLTLGAASPNSLAAFGSVSVTSDTITIPRNKRNSKIPFTIIVTAAITRNFVINRQPDVNDIYASSTRVIGDAALPIQGEDVSASTYYKWPISNVVGLKNGMFLGPGTNVTAGTLIADYSDSVTESITKKELYKGLKNIKEKENIDRSVVFEAGVQRTGEQVFTNGVLTSQTGNVVFNKKQADALKEDSVKIFGYGTSNINSLINYDISISDLQVELTPVTTTVDGAVSNNTNVTVDERAGIRDGVSTVTGIGIDTSSTVPTVNSGAGAVNGSGVIVLSAAQTLEDNITLTFTGASRIATITGNIQINSGGYANDQIYFDLEKFITAT